MTAKITIIDDNGNPKGAYELTPSIIRENGIITTYAFEFEYSQLNHDKYKDKAENKPQKSEEQNDRSN